MSNNDNNPIISIVITVQDSSPLFEQALLSCVHQTYSYTQIIVADMCCDDSIREIVERHTEDSSTIRYLPIKEGGLSHARNMALDLCEGEYLLFMTQEQEIQESWLERAVTRFSLSGADGIQCGTMYEKENVIAKVNIPNDSIFGFYQRLLVKQTIPLNSMVVKTSICARFSEEKNEAGDWEFWINTLRGKKVDVQPEFIGSIIHLSDKEHTKEIQQQTLQIMKQYYRELHPSIRKIRQFLKIKALEKQ